MTRSTSKRKLIPGHNFFAVKQAANRKGKGFVNALGHKNVV